MSIASRGIVPLTVGWSLTLSLAACGSSSSGSSSASRAPVGSFGSVLLRIKALPSRPASLQRTLPNPAEQYHQLFKRFRTSMVTLAANGEVSGCYPPKRFATLHWREGLSQWITYAVEHGGPNDFWTQCDYRFARAADARTAYHLLASTVRQSLRDGTSNQLSVPRHTGDASIGVSTSQGPGMGSVQGVTFRKGRS